jgi:hypothetical protein
MKTSFISLVNSAVCKTALVVAVMRLSISLASAAAPASNDDPASQPAAKALKAVVFQVEHSMKFKAHVENPNRKELKVRIRKADNTLVYEDRVHDRATYIRQFDLSNLADGEYTVVITNGEESYTQTIAVNTLTARVISVQ